MSGDFEKAIAREALEKAKANAKGNTELARLLAEKGHAITPQAVSQWDRVPAARARDVAVITGIPLHELRPDLWKTPVEAAE